ncbi:MAG TPA: tetratricopeptide repeat protein [Phycisphaerae bacterium]|nr:tetratricopeptide repeat protein [Phycisphaerae bacterium]
MSSAQHERLEQLFNATLERKTPAERAAFLAGACDDEPVLRASVEELLRAHDRAGSFLDAPAVDPNATLASAPASESPGTKIGRYKILQEIGEGGFGSVYLAEQEEPVRRKVALKIIKLGMDTKQVIARFEAERQALALMDHPNIAKVLDAGATETGRPYFVMELVKGVRITEYCDQSKLSTRQRLELFLLVCQAVQHAHQKGIIHRDIKPNNVLVTLHDTKPVPKVIDFGIAKATSHRLTEKTLFTEFRQFIGTPEYMSPDQAETSGLDVDTRTDIYSLGVLLYELLTGTTPFDARTLRSAGFDEIKRIIREVEPDRPSTRVATLAASGAGVGALRQSEPAALSKLIRGDLDWIVMKALEKDRTRRYQSASELANDVERHLNYEPVLAGPPGMAYKFSKFIRRNRVAVIAGSLIAVALVTGLSLATVGFIHATRASAALKLERDAAEAAQVEAEQARLSEQDQRQLAEANAGRARQANEFLQEMLASVDPSKALGREVTMRYVLDEAAGKIDEGALAEQPEVEAAVRMTLGRTYQALGLYAAAEIHLRAAEEIRRKELGDEHPDTLRSRSVLAGLLTSQHKYAQAEALARRTAETQSRVLGAEHPDTLASRNRLGVALRRQDTPDKLAEAESIHGRTLEIQQRMLGDRHIDTLRSQVNLGSVYQAQARYGLAEKVLGEALEVERRVLGDEHPEVTRAMNNLALTLERQGKYQAAEELYRKTWELDRRILGPDHPRTQIPMNNLLRVLRDQNKVTELRPLVADGLDRLRRAAERPDADALALHAYAWELLTCEPADLRDPERALPVARRAVELDGGKDANILDTLALAFQMTGDLDWAIETQQRAVARARAGGPYNLAELEVRLADLLLERGDVLRAARVSWGGLAGRLRDSLASDSVVGGSLVLRAQALMEEGSFAEAEPLLRACLATRQKVLPEGHWLIADARSLLGVAVAGQGKFAQAEPLLLDAFARVKDNPQAPRDCKRQARQRIVRLYESWGKPDQAAEWRGPVETGPRHAEDGSDDG